MTRLDLFLVMAHNALTDPKSWLNEKWKDEEARALALAHGFIRSAQ